MAIKTFDEIVNDLILRIRQRKPKVDTKIGSVSRDIIIDPVADQLSTFYAELAATASLQAISTATGEDLDRLAGNYGLTRKGAVPASGRVLLTKSGFNIGETVTVFEGLKVSTGEIEFWIVGTWTFSEGKKSLYEVTAFQNKELLDLAGITDKYAFFVNVEAVAPGTSGNVGALTITDHSIVGINNVINIEAFTGGKDEESDEDFRKRALLVLSGLGGGTSDNFRRIALENPNVVDAVVIGPSSPLMLRDGTTLDPTGVVEEEGTGGKVDIHILGSDPISNSEAFVYTDKSIKDIKTIQYPQYPFTDSATLQNSSSVRVGKNFISDIVLRGVVEGRTYYIGRIANDYNGNFQIDINDSVLVNPTPVGRAWTTSPKMGEALEIHELNNSDITGSVVIQYWTNSGVTSGQVANFALGETDILSDLYKKDPLYPFTSGSSLAASDIGSIDKYSIKPHFVMDVILYDASPTESFYVSKINYGKDGIWSITISAVLAAKEVCSAAVTSPTAGVYKLKELNSSGITGSVTIGSWDAITKTYPITASISQGTVLELDVNGLRLLSSVALSTSQTEEFQERILLQGASNVANDFVLGQSGLTESDLPKQPAISITGVVGSESGANFVEGVSYELQKDIDSSLPSVYANSTKGSDLLHWLSNTALVENEEVTKGTLNSVDSLAYGSAISGASRVTEIVTVKEETETLNENSPVVVGQEFEIKTKHYPIIDVSRIYNKTTGEEYTPSTFTESTGNIRFTGFVSPKANDVLQVDYRWYKEYQEWAETNPSGSFSLNNGTVDWSAKGNSQESSLEVLSSTPVDSISITDAIDLDTPSNIIVNVSGGGDGVENVNVTGAIVKDVTNEEWPVESSYVGGWTIKLNSAETVDPTKATILALKDVKNTRRDGTVITYNVSDYIIGNEFVSDVNTLLLLHMREGKGTTVYDHSVYENDGTSHNTNWAIGKFSYGVRFDGSAGYIEVPDSDSLDITGTMTLEAWIYPLENKEQIIVSKEGAYYLKLDSSSNLVFAIKDSGGTWHSITSTSVVSLEAWSYVAGVYNGETIEVFINGIRVGSVNV